jgi:hypothetical protein
VYEIPARKWFRSKHRENKVYVLCSRAVFGIQDDIIKINDNFFKNMAKLKYLEKTKGFINHNCIQMKLNAYKNRKAFSSACWPAVETRKEKMQEIKILSSVLYGCENGISPEAATQI